MVRKHLAFNNDIDYLSILDENGKLDATLEPSIPDETHLRIFRAVLLGQKI